MLMRSCPWSGTSFMSHCSKGMSIIWGYCGFIAQCSTALLLQRLLSALLRGSCPQTWQFGFDLSIYRNFIAIWFEPWVDFWQGEDITLQRQWDAKWLHAAYLVAGPYLFSQLAAACTSQGRRKPVRSLVQGFDKCNVYELHLKQCNYSTPIITMTFPMILVAEKKTWKKTKLPVLGVFKSGPSLPMAKLVSNEGIPLKQLWHLRIVKVRG